MVTFLKIFSSFLKKEKKYAFLEVFLQNINMSKLKLGITIGDINGVSTEVIIKALSDERILSLFTPIIYGSS